MVGLFKFDKSPCQSLDPTEMLRGRATRFGCCVAMFYFEEERTSADEIISTQGISFDKKTTSWKAEPPWVRLVRP